MLRIKRRRTQPRCDINGGIRFNTMNATGLSSRYTNQNPYQNMLRQNPGCIGRDCNCEGNNIEDGGKSCWWAFEERCCCKGAPYRNPILGYRKQLDCSYNCVEIEGGVQCSSCCPRKPTNTIYKDNYAKICGEARNHPHQIGICYQPVIRKVQNRHGYINDHYNYSSKQYLNRRCRNYRHLAFNFQGVPIMKKGQYTSEFATRCHGQPVTENNPQCPSPCTTANPCNPVKCMGYSKCDAPNNNNCCATYKPNNRPFSRQGAVSGGSRINRLKYQTRLKAQSTYKLLDTGSTACQIKCGGKNTTGSINATNGVYPVSLYRNTYPTYKRNLSGTCPTPHMYTCAQTRQRCWVKRKGMFCRHPRVRSVKSSLPKADPPIDPPIDSPIDSLDPSFCELS